MEKHYDKIRWAILGALAVGFLFEGIRKLFGKENIEFISWGFPVWFTYVVGTLQTVCALGLMYRPIVKMSLFFLTVITIGAILTLAGKHIFFPDILAPIAFLLGIFGLMYLKAKRNEDDEGRWGLI